MSTSPFRYYDPRTGTYSGGSVDEPNPSPAELQKRNRQASEDARRRVIAQLPRDLQAQAAADPVLADRYVDTVFSERGRVARLNRQIAPEDPETLDFDAREFSGETLKVLTDYVKTRSTTGATAMPGVQGMPTRGMTTDQPSAYPAVPSAVPKLPRIIADHPSIAAEVLAAGITDIRVLSDIARAIRGAQLHERLANALPIDVERILATSTQEQLAGFADFDGLFNRYIRDGREIAPEGDIPVDGGDQSWFEKGLNFVKDTFLDGVQAVDDLFETADHIVRANVAWAGSMIDPEDSDGGRISPMEAWRRTESGQLIQKQIEDAKARWSPEAVDLAVRLVQAGQSDDPAAEIARLVSEVSESGSQEEQDLMRAAFGGYGIDDDRHQSAKDLLHLVQSSQGGSVGDVLATELGLTAGTVSYGSVSLAGSTIIPMVLDPGLIAGKVFTTYRAAMYGMEKMVGPTADLTSLFFRKAGEGVAGAARRRMVTRLWDEVGKDVSKYLDAPNTRNRAVARDVFIKRWSTQFGEKTGQVLEDLVAHQVPGQAKAGVRDAAGAYSYLEDQNRVLNVMFGRSALMTKTIPRMSATRLAAQRALGAGRSINWDRAGDLLDQLYGEDLTGESVAATQGTSGLTTKLRDRGLAPREEDTFRYSQTAARLVGGEFDPKLGRMTGARLGANELADWLRDTATDAPRLKYMRAYKPAHLKRAMGKFSRWFERHPAAFSGIAFNGDDVAEGAEVVYRMARTFTSKGHAALLRQSWMEVTPAQRRSMFEGLIRTQADAMGFALGFADREKRIDDLVRAHTNSEQYSPIILSHRFLPSIGQADRISVQKYLDQNLGRVGENGNQFVPDQDRTFGQIAYQYGVLINAATDRKAKLSEEILAYSKLQKALTMRLRDASRAAATEDDLKRLAAELAATKAAIKQARDGIRNAEKQVAVLQRQSMNKTKKDLRTARGLASDEAREDIDDAFASTIDAFDIAGKLINQEINVLGRTAEQEFSRMGSAVSRATGGDVSDPAMAAVMGANATGRPAIKGAKDQARKGAAQANSMAKGDARAARRELKKDIDRVLMDQFGMNAQALSDLAADLSATQKLAFLEQIDDMRKIAVELKVVDKDIAKLRRKLKKQSMPDAEIDSIEQEILALKKSKGLLRAESARLSWRNMALIEEKKMLQKIDKDAAVVLDPSNPFWSPSLIGGKHYALHRYQVTDRATLPDFEVMQRYSRRNGLLHSLIGATWSRPATTAVNLWSLGVLAGPRFALRNSLEEWVFHLAAGGSVDEAYKGRAIAQEQMEIDGASTGFFRKRGKDLRSGKKIGLIQTEGGLNGRSGSRASASESTERLLDEKTGQMLPSVQSRVWWKRAVLPYLNADELAQARALFDEGDGERMKQLLHAATMRRMFAGKRMSAVQDSYTRAAYTRYAASVADEVADSIRLGMSGHFEGDPKTVMAAGWNFFDEGRKVSDGFVNIRAEDKELASSALHDSLTKIFERDGEMAQIVARALHRNATVMAAREEAIPKLRAALNIDAMRKAFDDADLGSLGISRGYIGWTDDMVAAAGNPGEFADRYFASLAHNLSDSTGFLPNQKLLDMLLKDGRYRTMTRTEDGDVIEYATPDNILALFAGSSAEHPPWVLGETTSRQFDHLLAIGDKRLAASDELWRHMGMMNARMSRLPIFHANSMNAYAIAKPAEDMIAALLRGDLEAQAKAAKVYQESIDARSAIETDLNDWWDRYTSAIPDSGSIDDMPVVWRGKAISDAVDYVEWVRREIAVGGNGWRYSPSRGEVLPDWAKSLTGDAFPISPDVAERIIGQQADDLLARVQPVLSGGRAHPAIDDIDDLLVRVGGSAGMPHPLALVNEADAAAAFAARGGSSFSLADPTGYRDWRGTHPLNQGNYKLKAINQLHEDEVVRLRATMGLDADEADAVWDEARTAAANRVVEWAQSQGMAATMLMADNPAVRSNAAYALRNFSRFYRATEDFYRRVYRMGRYNPQGIYKMALAYDMLTDAGGSAKDDQGNEYFVYPGINPIFQAVSNQFGIGIPQDVNLDLTGQFSMLSPSLDASGWVPTLSGPLAAFAYSGLQEGVNKAGLNGASQFFRDNEGFFLGKLSQGRSLMEQTIPTPLLQLFGPDGVTEAWMVRTPQERREMTMRIAKDVALADWLQNRDEQPGLMDAEAQSRRDQTLYATARNMMTMRYLLRFMLPASPQVDLPRSSFENLAGITLNPVFAARVRQLTAEGDVNAFGTATAEFSKLYPQLPLLQESVNEPSQPGARPAATRQSAAWMRDHARLIEEGNVDLALPFLIPAQPGEEYYFPANTEAKRIGAKRSRSYGEYRDSLNAAVGVADWFELSQLISVYRAEIMGQRDQRKLKYFEEEASKLKAQFRSENPDLDEWLRNTSQSGYSTAAFPVSTMKQVESWVLAKVRSNRKPWPHEWAMVEANSAMSGLASAMNETRAESPGTGKLTRQKSAIVGLLADIVSETEPDYQLNVANYIRAVLLPQMNDLEAYSDFKVKLLNLAQEKKGGSGG